MENGLSLDPNEVESNICVERYFLSRDGNPETHCCFVVLLALTAFGRDLFENRQRLGVDFVRFRTSDEILKLSWARVKKL